MNLLKFLEFSIFEISVELLLLLPCKKKIDLLKLEIEVTTRYETTIHIEFDSELNKQDSWRYLCW